CRASLLRPGQTRAAQPLEQGEIRRNRIDADGLAVQSKLDRTHVWGAHATRVPPKATRLRELGSEMLRRGIKRRQKKKVCLGESPRPARESRALPSVLCPQQIPCAITSACGALPKFEKTNGSAAHRA